MWYSSQVYVERGDVETLRVGDTVTLINWGNVIISKITRCITSCALWFSSTPCFLGILKQMSLNQWKLD